MPSTNLYLQGRGDTTRVRRGITPIKKIYENGVKVAIASDNIRDPFNCFGNGVSVYSNKDSTPVYRSKIIMSPNTVSQIINLSEIIENYNVNAEHTFEILIILETYDNPYVKNEQILRISTDGFFEKLGDNSTAFAQYINLYFGYRPSKINNRGEILYETPEYVNANDFNIIIHQGTGRNEIVFEDEINLNVKFSELEFTDYGGDYFNWINNNITTSTIFTN